MEDSPWWTGQMDIVAPKDPPLFLILQHFLTMTNLDSTLKSRAITLLTKVYIVKAMVFPVVMYGCESWTIKKAKHWRIDALELWYWRRLLRVPWTVRRSNQSILKETNHECLFEDWCWSSNNLVTWCEEPTHWKRPGCWERLKAGGKGDDRGWDGCMPSLTQWTWVWASFGRWWRTGKPGVLQCMESQSRTRLSNNKNNTSNNSLCCAALCNSAAQTALELYQFGFPTRLEGPWRQSLYPWQQFHYFIDWAHGREGEEAWLRLHRGSTNTKPGDNLQGPGAAAEKAGEEPTCCAKLKGALENSLVKRNNILI